MNNELDGEHWNKVQFECTIDWSESSIITMNKVQSEGQEGDSKLKHLLQATSWHHPKSTYLSWIVNNRTEFLKLHNHNCCTSQSISTASIVYNVHKALLGFEFWGGLLNVKIAADPHWDCKWDLNLSNSIKCKVPGPLQFWLLSPHRSNIDRNAVLGFRNLYQESKN